MLTKLEEGLVIRIPCRGAFVVEVTAGKIAEISSVRLLVEPHAAELSLEELRGAARPELMGIIEELHRPTEQNDIPASTDAHLRFHRLFYDMSGQGVLQTMWNGWESTLRLYLTADHATYRSMWAPRPTVAKAASSADSVPMLGWVSPPGTARNPWYSYAVARSAGAKKAPMELGGNGAVNVLPDADLSRAAAAVVDGAFGNAGQNCLSASACSSPGSVRRAD